MTQLFLSYDKEHIGTQQLDTMAKCHNETLSQLNPGQRLIILFVLTAIFLSPSIWIKGIEAKVAATYILPFKSNNHLQDKYI
jgi:hypothetical protein